MQHTNIPPSQSATLGLHPVARKLCALPYVDIGQRMVTQRMVTQHHTQKLKLVQFLRRFDVCWQYVDQWGLLSQIWIFIHADKVMWHSGHWKVNWRRMPTSGFYHAVHLVQSERGIAIVSRPSIGDIDVPWSYRLGLNLIISAKWTEMPHRKLHWFGTWQRDGEWKKSDLIKCWVRSHHGPPRMVTEWHCCMSLLVVKGYVYKDVCLCICVCVCAAKFGTPNQRIETLFSFVPEIRSLGMLHYKMTKTLSLQAEDVMKFQWTSYSHTLHSLCLSHTTLCCCCM